MIRVCYDSGGFRVAITGHAGAGKAGEDVVCAAVSALAWTLAGNVSALESQGAVKELHLRLEKGCCHISCAPLPMYRSQVRLIFGAVCLGLAGLARRYPEYVEYRRGKVGVRVNREA